MAEPYPLPRGWVTVPNELIHPKLVDACPGAQIFIRNSFYRLIPKEDMEKFLGKDKTDRKEYVKEFYDCDDFSLVLAGRVNLWFPNAFGILWLSQPPHAMNVFIDTHLKVWLVEPQDDSMYEPPKFYKYRLIIV